MKIKLSNILIGLSYVGVPVTAILTHTGTKKAIENSKDGKEDLKYYIPAAVAGAATIGCGIASHRLDKKEIAKLTALAAGLGKAYDMYRNTNIKVNGMGAHERVMEEIQKAEDANIADPCFCGMYRLNSEMDSEERLFYDTVTEQFFTSTLSRVIDAEYHTNRNLTGGMVVDTDIWCSYLGIKNPKGKGNDKRGWCIIDDLYWIDFDNSEGVIDGKECIVIEPCVMMMPEKQYEEYI
jgi:hypothetical protein